MLVKLSMTIHVTLLHSWTLKVNVLMKAALEVPDYQPDNRIHLLKYRESKVSLSSNEVTAENDIERCSTSKRFAL